MYRNGDIFMNQQNMDKRVRRSIKLIQDSFFTLSKEMPFDKITIMDICKRADINRCTFYSHYENIDALVDALEKELAEKFMHAFSLYKYDKNPRTMVDALFDCIRKNPELFSFAKQVGRSSKSYEVLKKVMQERTFSEWRNKSKITEDQALLLEAYAISGGRRILEMWYDSNFTMDENMVKDLFENVIKYGLYHFIYTK